MFLRIAAVRGFWGYFLPLDVAMSTSMLYELIEWGAAVYFGGELGTAFLGSQGDPWGAQKDMALASLGALLTMIAAACVNAACQRDFEREWVDSLRVRGREPARRGGHPADAGRRAASVTIFLAEASSALIASSVRAACPARRRALRESRLARAR